MTVAPGVDSQSRESLQSLWSHVFLLAAIALGLLTVPLAGGRLSYLGQLRLRWTPLIFGALAIQILIVSVIPHGNEVIHRSLHLGSYALAAVFLVVNRHIAGLPIIGLGALLNAAAIVANNGVMPASRAALRSAGFATTTGEFENSGLVDDPKLAFLGDIFAIPQGWPFSNVFSIGDICIAIGAVVALHAVTHSRLTRRTAASA